MELATYSPMARPALMVGLILVGAIGIVVTPGHLNADVPAQQSYKPQRIVEHALPNAQWVTRKVISGGSPVGEEGFAALSRLGVKTVLSVDGAAPEVGLAHRGGLTYVHLPHGYDGVPKNRTVELAKAVRDLPGPIYIHCHHGKHRSPAAAAVACVGAGLLPAHDALAVLTSAGTSPYYRGLYQSAQGSAPVDEEKLSAAPCDFPETAKAPPLVDLMVVIERTHDHLLQIEQAGWKSPAEHPDLDPAHEALLLRELYTEPRRTIDHSERSSVFWKAVAHSESLARRLEEVLRQPSPSPQSASAALAAVNADCKTCHATHRDVPLGEK